MYAQSRQVLLELLLSSVQRQEQHSLIPSSKRLYPELLLVAELFMLCSEKPVAVYGIRAMGLGKKIKAFRRLV